MMTLKQIYDLAIAKGVNADPRDNDYIKNILKKDKEKYNKLEPDDKDLFDKEELTNPYSDTRILYGPPSTKVKRILIGIDIEVGELIIAKEHPPKGKKIDLTISHHPHGKALAGLDDVMKLQADLLSQYGIPINVAEGLLEKKREEVFRSVSPSNHNKVVDIARLIDMPFICIHTPADNLVYEYLKNELEDKGDKFYSVGDILKFLKSIPEYKLAAKVKAGPTLFCGKPDRRPGKIAVTEMTGGTEGSKHIYEKLAQAGIGTIIGMHMQEEHKKEAEKHHLNVIIAGHMASDSLGLNLFMDELEKKKIDIVPCGGFIRVARNKK